MKKVMIAIDYNANAQKVAETGYEYARAMNAEISVVHAIGDIGYYAVEYSHIIGFEGLSPDSCFMNVEDQENEAKTFLTAVAQYLGDKNITTRVLSGRVATTILEYATEWKADVIVMGTQSYRGLEKILEGEVVGRVLRYSQIPILIIPPDKEDVNSRNEKEYMHLYI